MAAHDRACREAPTKALQAHHSLSLPWFLPEHLQERLPGCNNGRKCNLAALHFLPPWRSVPYDKQDIGETMTRDPGLFPPADPALVAKVAKAMAEDQERKRAEAEAEARMSRIESKLDQILAILAQEQEERANCKT